LSSTTSQDNKNTIPTKSHQRRLGFVEVFRRSFYDLELYRSIFLGKKFSSKLYIVLVLFFLSLVQAVFSTIAIGWFLQSGLQEFVTAVEQLPYQSLTIVGGKAQTDPAVASSFTFRGVTFSVDTSKEVITDVPTPSIKLSSKEMVVSNGALSQVLPFSYFSEEEPQVVTKDQLVAGGNFIYAWRVFFICGWFFLTLLFLFLFEFIKKVVLLLFTVMVANLFCAIIGFRLSYKKIVDLLILLLGPYLIAQMLFLTANMTPELHVLLYFLLFGCLILMIRRSFEREMMH